MMKMLMKNKILFLVCFGATLCGAQELFLVDLGTI